MIFNRQISLFLLFLTTFVLTGCIVRQTAEHMSGATIENGLGESFFHLSPKAGQNEVLIFRREKIYFFPPTGGLTYLFIEIAPDFVKIDEKLNIPSTMKYIQDSGVVLTSRPNLTRSILRNGDINGPSAEKFPSLNRKNRIGVAETLYT